MSILKWLSRVGTRNQAQADSDSSVAQATELAIVGIDARLRLVTDYARRLRPAIERALAYCGALAAAIPGPIELDPGAWQRDAALRALFAQPGDIEILLGHSLELLAFAEQPVACASDELWAVMSMARVERKVLGWASQGEILQREVPQRTVSFARHRLLIPSTQEAELHREVQWRAYEHLVVEALGGVLRAGTPAPSNGRIEALLQERLELLQRARSGLEACREPPVADETAYNATRLDLLRNGEELAALRAHGDLPQGQLERVAAILARPEDFIAYDSIEDRLTALNVVAASDEDAAAKLRLALITARGPRSFTRAAVMVRVHRSQLKAQSINYSNAELWL